MYKAEISQTYRLIIYGYTVYIIVSRRREDISVSIERRIKRIKIILEEIGFALRDVLYVLGLQYGGGVLGLAKG